METLYNSLVARRADLCGRFATSVQIESLRKELADASFIPLLHIYRDLPVCRMETAFELCDGLACAQHVRPSAEYDSERDHCFYWTSPVDVLQEILDGVRGTIAFRAGYVRIGICVYGGEGYFLSSKPNPPGSTPLYRVYYDWISYPELGDRPVPPEAIHLVHPSFEEIIAVAAFKRGWMPEQ